MQNFELEETLRRIWCIKCGMTSFRKDGKTSDGRQRVKCIYCKSRTTVGALRRGERRFNKNNLLPILQKESSNLSKEELYCLGLLVADGCLKRHDTIALSLDIKDIDTVKRVKEILQIPSQIRVYSRRKSTCAEISWQYKFSEPYWNSLGIYSKKTGNEIWLDWMCSPHFVRGYLDGEGCIHISSYVRLSWVCINRKFLENLSLYLYNKLKVGYSRNRYSSAIAPSNILSALTNNKNGNVTYGLRYRKKDMLKICEFLYQDSENLRMERKYEKYLKAKSLFG